MARKKAQDVIADWVAIRKRILARDGYRCRICGADGVEARLNVHHKDCIRKHNEDSNLVTLCSTCHQGVHKEDYRPADYEDWPVPWGEDPSD